MAKSLLKIKYRAISFFLTCIAILGADLAIVLINKWVIKYDGVTDRRLIVLVGMLSVLILFFVLIKGINKFTEWFTEKFVHITRVYLGRVIGLYIAITALFLLIFAGYYYAWYDRNFFYEIFSAVSALVN